MKKFMSQFDLFPASPILRANGESEVVNLCGSIFSILIFGVFAYLFISSMVQTVQLQQITASEITKINPNNQKRISNITVGVGLQLDQLNRIRNILQVRAFVVNERMQPTEISTFPCTREMWSNFTDQQYSNLGLGYAICVQQEGVEIYGDFGGSSMRMLQVGLYACSNSSSAVTCGSVADMVDYFTNNMIMGRFIAVSFVILDTGLNPTNQNPYTYRAYQKTQWLLCNTQQLIMGQVFLGTYQLNTDVSFLPFVQQKTQQGYFVSQAITTTMVNYQNLPIYVELYIIASPISKIVNRQYGKVDSVLSYVGGLYGIVIGFIGIFLLSFNQYRYQLRVSQGAFSFRDGHLAREKDLHFGKYLKYVAYDWIKTFFCYEPEWRDCQAIDQARQEAIQQIDIKHLLKRISHLQKVLSTVVDDKDEALIFMSESNSIEQAKHRRAIVEYCQKFTDATTSITIKNFDQINAIFQLGLNSKLSTVTPADFTSNLMNEAQKKNIIELSEQNKDSFQIMEEYLKRYTENFKINKDMFVMSQEDLGIEEELAQAFYSVDQETRLKLIKKIPLGILYRINECKQKIAKQNPTFMLQTVQQKPQRKKANDESLQISTLELIPYPQRPRKIRQRMQLAQLDQH